MSLYSLESLSSVPRVSGRVIVPDTCYLSRVLYTPASSSKWSCVPKFHADALSNKVLFAINVNIRHETLRRITQRYLVKALMCSGLVCIGQAFDKPVLATFSLCPKESYQTAPGLYTINPGLPCTPCFSGECKFKGTPHDNACLTFNPKDVVVLLKEVLEKSDGNKETAGKG